MRRSRCEIGERHTAVRRFEQYVDSRWRRRFNQSSSQSVRFVWLEPMSLAENHIEIARRSGCRWRQSQVRSQHCRRVPNGNRGVPEGARPGPAQPRLALHPGALAGERNENRSALRAIPAPQSRRSRARAAKRCVRVMPRTPTGICHPEHIHGEQPPTEFVLTPAATHSGAELSTVSAIGSRTRSRLCVGAGGPNLTIGSTALPISSEPRAMRHDGLSLRHCSDDSLGRRDSGEYRRWPLLLVL